MRAKARYALKLLVTGHDDAGRAVFSYTGSPPRELHPGSYELWSTQGPLAVPDAADPRAPSAVGYFPVDGETAFKVVSVPGLAARAQAAAAEPATGLGDPETARYFDAQDPEMHTTDTIDYVIVLGGEAELELDDGVRETVRRGDCIVQRGTRHAWRVTSEEPLVLGAVLIGARRR